MTRPAQPCNVAGCAYLTRSPAGLCPGHHTTSEAK